MSNITRYQHDRLGLYHLTLALLLGMVIGASMILGIVFASPAHADGPQHRILRACLSDEGESAFPCVWDAKDLGNHTGHSFRIYRDGRLKYITHRRAYNLLGGCDSNGPIYC